MKGFRAKAAPTKNQMAQAVSQQVDQQSAVIDRLQQQIKFAINSSMQTMQAVRNNENMLNSVTSLLRMSEKTTGAEAGDAVLFDFIGFLQNDDGSIGEEHFEGGYGLGHLILNLGESNFLKDFEQGIYGLKAGDSNEVVVTFPADYHDALKNKKATFKLSVIKVWKAAETQTAVEKALEKSLNLKKAKEEAAKAAVQPEAAAEQQA